MIDKIELRASVVEKNYVLDKARRWALKYFVRRKLRLLAAASVSGHA
jgi:hypothetical protein